MKTTWIWIVVGIVVLVLLTTSLREGFEATDIRRPTLSDESFRQDVSIYAGVPRQDTEAVNLYLKYAEQFYDDVFVPQKTTLANSEASLDSEIKGFVDEIDVSTIPTQYRTRFKPALESILDSYFGPPPFTPEGGAPPADEATPSTGGTATPPGSAGTGATTASTTGGDSGVTYGPTSAPKGGRNVWGPLFKGIGEGPGPQGGDSTKSNAYPALLGGMGGRTGTMLESVGIVPPSGFGLDAVMPSSSALGTDANARFLPYSRQPGDMDIVPDPYRLASNFSTSSYSASKTDPVPFLTDFSAFYR